ncbi:hypothetical protein J4Q44_G00023510 [Coregonus suidteri]|uniref:Uncharacterized protein n=1 Tax=Coregonus suidteri TaxID=861788 RepID=A0AAN8R6A7_9TELE
MCASTLRETNPSRNWREETCSIMFRWICESPALIRPDYRIIFVSSLPTHLCPPHHGGRSLPTRHTKVNGTRFPFCNRQNVLQPNLTNEYTPTVLTTLTIVESRRNVWPRCIGKG